MDDQPKKRFFDKTRKRVEKFEETNETFAKVSKHVQANKLFYIGAPIVFVAGQHFRRPINIDFQPVIDFKPVINNMPTFNNHNVGNSVKNVVNNVGHLHKIVKRTKPDGTEEWFEAISDAARALAPGYGIQTDSAFDRISKVANGHLSNYKGDVFEFVGIGTR